MLCCHNSPYTRIEQHLVANIFLTFQLLHGSTRTVFVDVCHAIRASSSSLSPSRIEEFKVGSHSIVLEASLRASSLRSMKCIHAVNTWKHILSIIIGSPTLLAIFFKKTSGQKRFPRLSVPASSSPLFSV